METREEIQRRLLAAAARFWGYQESEMDVAGFDPLVGFLVGAFAEELARVNRTQQRSEARITDRILELLSPDVLTGPLPAHGVLYARALHGAYQVGPQDQFLISQREDDGPREYAFACPKPVRLVDIGLRYLEVGGQQLFTLPSGVQREPLLRPVHSDRVEAQHTVWLALEIGSEVKTLADWRFFFHWLNYPRLANLLRQLTQARWSVGGRPLQTEAGIRYDSDRKGGREVQSPLYREYDISDRITEEVFHHYRSHFVTVTGLSAADSSADLSSLMTFYPPELESVYGAEALSVLDRKLLWIKVEFPTYFPISALRETICLPNCFPVLNLRRHQQDWRLQESVNIIPLDTEDHYFDITRVANRAGRQYHQIPLTNIRKYRTGEYSIRKRDLGKFNEREASRLLHDLVDFLRDESAAFAALGKDEVRADIRLLNQQITNLEQSLKGRGKRSGIPYLIANPLPEDKQLTIEYWSTAGERANKIPAGLEVGMYRFTSIHRSELALVTSTMGGRDPLSRQAKALAYKKAILSRGRVVTPEDIKAYCEARLGGQLSKVTIRSAYRTGATNQVGLHRVLEVVLTSTADSATPGEEQPQWPLWTRELEEELNRYSSGVLPIYVLIDGANELKVSA